MYNYIGKYLLIWELYIFEWTIALYINTCIIHKYKSSLCEIWQPADDQRNMILNQVVNNMVLNQVVNSDGLPKYVYNPYATPKSSPKYIPSRYGWTDGYIFMLIFTIPPTNPVPVKIAQIRPIVQSNFAFNKPSHDWRFVKNPHDPIPVTIWIIDNKSDIVIPVIGSLLVYCWFWYGFGWILITTATTASTAQKKILRHTGPGCVVLVQLDFPPQIATRLWPGWRDFISKNSWIWPRKRTFLSSKSWCCVRWQIQLVDDICGQVGWLGMFWTCRMIWDVPNCGFFCGGGADVGLRAEAGRGVEPITCSLSTKPGQYLKGNLSNEALVKLWLGEITVL